MPTLREMFFDGHSSDIVPRRQGMRGCSASELCAARDVGADNKTPDIFRVDIKTGEKTVYQKEDETMPGSPKGAHGETRAKVKELLDHGINNHSEIARRLGINPVTVDYHIRRIEEDESRNAPPAEPSATQQIEAAPTPKLQQIINPPAPLSCNECDHEPVCGIKHRRAEIENEIRQVANTRPAGISVEYSVVCEHARAKEAGKVA